ncbi:dynein axonemal heavy chain 2 [Diabrotica virgifera virgifera]|uniref:Dynein heavy chain 2, axonemal n=1 Tax=Diabrotica virgifera virgifera TaxID=50390 RepID=A0ABM5JKM8_DIAVI|nr:dynein axonemal heavy chain 2 [Diabrotica virgifera virgifera]
MAATPPHVVLHEDADVIEKDSLFSSEEPEEVVVEEVQEETSLDRLVDYSEEDINTLVSYVKSITTLYKLKPTDWTEENEDVIKTWFRDPSLPILCVFFSTDNLICTTGLPDGAIEIDLMYFLRETAQEFSVQTFHDNITFGTVDENIEGTLLNIIKDVFVPILLSTEKWPDSVKNEFCQNVQMFLARLTDLHYKLFGLTILYVPQEVLRISLEDANVDKELIKRLEGIVVYWTKQIRVGLQDQDQNTPEDLLCPQDEFEFWKYRYENLLGLNYQLNDEGIQHICNILQSVQSTYVRQFKTFEEEIVKCIEESKSNIEYLNVLVEPCDELAQTKNPEEFADKLPKIFHLIRFIWLKSPYYNTKEKITQLFRAVSNQLIFQCREFIDLEVLFRDKQTRKAIKMFQTSVDALTNYIRTYVLVSALHRKHTQKKPWELDKAPIFNHIDSFIQRCKDLIEVCETMICFGRYDETENIPKPMFGGAKGVDFDNWAKRIESMYNEALTDIDKVKFRILEVNASEWYDDILKFRTRMKDIEVVIENLTNAVFDNIANIEEGIESLAALHNFTKRKTLTSLFEGKTLLIYNMFKEEIIDTKLDIQAESEMRPALMPYFAGRAHMMKMKKRRLKMLRSLFEGAGWMMPCSIARDVFGQYEKLIAAIADIILNLYRKWVDNIGEDVNLRLNRSLMIKSVARPGLLECNIDRSLLEIFHEATYWEMLQYEIPMYVKSVYQKKDTIKFMYECVLNVVLDYNKIISSFSDDERLLFKPLISAVEKKISPGLSKLTWGTDIGDEYIAECSNTTAELQAFVDDYKSCNLKIVAICEKICDSPLICLKPNYAFDKDELIEELTDSIENVVSKLVDYYQEIIQFLIFVFEGFEFHMGTMGNQWIKYINNFDTLMEEALKICCKNSLELMYEALHGDGTTEPNPLIKLQANLIDNRIKFQPTLSEVAHVIANIHKSLVEALTTLPRLNDKFHIAETAFKPYSEIIAQDPKCQELQVLLDKEFKVNVDKIKEYLQTWEPFRDLWEVDKEKFIVRYEKEDPSPLLFDANIARYTELANNVNIQETVTAVHFMQINCAELKHAIIEHCIEWQEKLCALLFKMTNTKIMELYQYIKLYSEEIMKEPTNLEEMQAAINLFDILNAEVPIREETFLLIHEQIVTLDKYNVPIPDLLRQQEKNIPKEWAAYLELLEQADKMLEYSKEKFKTALLEQAEISRKEARELLADFQEHGPFTSEISAKDALAYLADIRAKLNAMRGRDEELRNDLTIFGISFGDNIDLSKLDAELTTLEIVWTIVDEWDTAWEKYKSGEFWAIETVEMEETAQNLFRKLTKLSREFKEKGWTIIDDTRARVDAFRRTLPLIGDLKNPAMRTRHWDKVRKVVEVDFDETSKDFNLEAIYAMELHKFAEEINEISNAATMELQIENGIAAISKTWETMKFEMIPYKERHLYRIKSVDECFQVLEENLMQLSIMKSTRFVEPFTKEVDRWERGLSYIMECLEMALQVQREWLYLENIFFGEDIRKQLPKEREDFDHLTETWVDITTRLYFSKSALKATHFRPPPYLLNKLNKMFERLDLLQRALEKYLETKRHIFPRFYFISNDDMLEILGNSRKPELVQQHLKKLFDNIIKIKILKNVGANKQECVGMFSDDGEFIEFSKVFFIEGPSEEWLGRLETAMQVTLKTLFKPIRSDLKKNLNKRDRWLMNNCGQLCNACSLIQWTTDCTRALVHSKILESKKPLKRLRKKQNQVLNKLSELSRKELTKLQRLKTNALITIEIHSRDVIDRLYKANCRDTNAFEWFSQLRFYWDRDLDDCVIRQTNTSFMYGYEYNGNSGRLVITPLTDRCYITLTTALHLYRGGSPKGPAGTGKTETVKDLGKAMGMWVIVNNCSEGLDYKSMGKCFSGLAQTGAWGCFDEFNRINIEVLSVVAQQILCILSAVSQKERLFVFEGLEIKLKLTVGIFITMNPGYAGRTELPDNLKSMFRPISMMVPDSNIIAENVLFSDGFQNTKQLARKVFTLYRLAVQQLSKQDHYDFGLRSMVALLRYAGRKRRQMPNLPEEQMVYLAMRDMNIARLTSDDLPLFNGIMSDIFPGVVIPMVDYMDMNIAMTEYMEEHNLQPIPIATIKVLQLYETKNSRHSVMILGNTCTAKTVTWKMLQGANRILKKQKKPGFNNVEVFPLNPKALNLAELYGEYNLATGEWLDGCISAIMRQTCHDESPDEKWILFDGPVDAVWIENMNSVMDDNKVLTLINSDRITMPEQVSLLFEVGDLAVASPATVSRCGMVYNDYKDWGWQPYVYSWVKSKSSYGNEFMERMTDLFQVYVKPILEFKRLYCEENVQCAELNLVISCCNLLNIFMTKEFGFNPKNEEKFYDCTKSWFLFCVIWSICSTTDEDGRKKLDAYVRERESVFPIKDTIYEYFVEQPTFGFTSWSEKLPYGWRYEQGCPFYKITVPTVDTIRYDFLLKSLLINGYPVLMTGPVGTGKSSVAHSALAALDAEKYTILNVNMSAQTSSNNLQDSIESRLEKRTKGHYAPPRGKKLVSFLDDMNMPAKETYGSQPPLELLRQWIDYGFWYDRAKQARKYVEMMHVIGAMGPPGGGRNVISERLLSCFNVINMTFPEDETLSRIFGTMLGQHLADFDEMVKLVGREITETTIDLYKNVVVKMLPTPAKMHYLFNLRDISRIFQGMLRSHKDYQNDKSTLLRLWIHECYRVFYDRLIDEQDQEWFSNQMNEQLGRHFELTLHSLCPAKQIPVYADFVNPYQVYEEFTDFTVLRQFLDQQMEDYNVSPGVVRMNLVLFKDAIEHICRIVRVISQPRGNMLLIGIGGSGRTSLTRIAAYICEFGTFQINITKNYKVFDLKEDLKNLYALTGVNLKPQAFIFNDTQITVESFLEIINNMLSSGEVANLYKPDEFEDVKRSLETAINKFNILPTNEAIYEFLVSRVRANMHIVLCMSPIGDAFRNRLRQYPALINCTTIDWFQEWPQEALLEVANKYIADVNFVQTITGEEATKRRDSLILTTQDKMRQAVSTVFATIHGSVAAYSKRMLREIKRHNYVTPTNYLELVAGYKKMLATKRESIASQANKLRNGLYKIDDCKDKVSSMSIELAEAQVQVAEFQQQCDEYLVIIVTQRKEADDQQKEVTKTSIKIGEEEIQCKRLAELAQADLDEAMPALEEAIRALDALSKKDISEMKSYQTPPQKVKMVMEAVNILVGIEPNWENAKKLLGGMNFLQDLKDFDKNHISEKTLKKIATYTMNEEFIPDKVGIVSFAAKSLCMWVIAIEKYAKIWKIVGPKKAKLDEALESLQEKQRQLAEAQAKLAELNLYLQKLQKEYEEKLLQKEELNRKAELLKIKLERAAMLVENLSGERERWSETVMVLDDQFVMLPGDCLLATAFISYLGPFLSNYREELLDLWQTESREQEIVFSADFNIIHFLTDPTTVREWNIQGLPADNFSTENGILICEGNRWPLVIDPQCQAQKWIKAKEEEFNLQVFDLRTAGYMTIVERAVQFGYPVLLQNIGESIDPSLEPILAKAIVKSGGELLIKLEDKLVSYHSDFRFFITTKLTNPHYPPEICTKATLVNFAVKEQGLEGQLLGIVVRKEKPQLEEQKDELVTAIAKGKRTLMDLENELLRLLAESRGSLLEDAELFDTLQVSKATSETVKRSLEISETTEVQIDAAREGYRPSANRASILFFVLNDMGQIDPMYQFALDAYILLFINSINRSPKSNELSERITLMNEYHTFAVYQNTCRALFEHHKLLFSFHMCMKILKAQGKIVKAEYDFLLKGGVVLDRTKQVDNPCSAWLSEIAWDNITELDKLQGFHGVIDTFEQYQRDWMQWYIHTEPETLPLIGEWDGICNEFQKMLFIRSLRQDRVSFALSNFIVNQLGPQFVEPPVLDIKAVLEESSPQTPLIFVLSPGVDPTQSLIQLAEQANMSSRFQSISLGQGQAPIATKLLQMGAKDGHWVFLANCHLSLSWMPKLDKIIEMLQSGKVHSHFRVWLSSSPHPEFPISILQAGIKMTTEPPKGLKANLKRLYQLISEDQFTACQYPEKYKKLLFALCFFHSILLERKKFQQLGWNVIYSFNDSDFQVSENLLTIYLNEYQVTPWDALKYLIAGVSYGGHVTDDWDRRLLTTYINQYFCEDALMIAYFRLSSLSTYYIPRDGSIQSYLDYITLLPNVDRPEAFGQHPNADITSLINESRMLFETLMSLQVQTAAEGGESKEQKVHELSDDVLSKLPKTIDYENTEKLMGAHKTPLDVVLLQEIQRYNTLLVVIQTSLEDLGRGIRGLVVMSSELEEIFDCIFDGRVPSTWLTAYSSLKLLGSWTRDLVARVEHFSVWAKTLRPPLFFWLAAYTFPTGFLTAVLQTTARAAEVPIDTLGWDFTVLTIEEQMIQLPPENGVYVKGTFLEGAGWDKKNAMLIEPQPMQLVSYMPLIHFKPVEQLKKKTKGLYQCPCYYFPIRTGSANRPAFVVAVDLRVGLESSDFWIKRGTALLLSLAN